MISLFVLFFLSLAWLMTIPPSITTAKVFFNLCMMSLFFYDITFVWFFIKWHHFIHLLIPWCHSSYLLYPVGPRGFSLCFTIYSVLFTCCNNHLQQYPDNYPHFSAKAPQCTCLTSSRHLFSLRVASARGYPDILALLLVIAIIIALISSVSALKPYYFIASIGSFPHTSWQLGVWP